MENVILTSGIDATLKARFDPRCIETETGESCGRLFVQPGRGTDASEARTVVQRAFVGILQSQA